MRSRPTVARVARKLLGERYGAARFIAVSVQERLTGQPERALFAKRFADREGTVIRRGPFKGMRFFNRVTGPTTLVPMLLGTYEEELHRVIDEEMAREPPVVVNIGAAEGYYAVGMARELPRTRIVAFDTDPMARHMCRRLAGLNGVSGRVEVRGECDAAYLSRLLPDSLIMSDCEGAEKDLLDPDRAPALKTARIVVEVHDFIDPMISRLLRCRFAPSHHINELPTRPRDPSAYSELASYSRVDAARAVSEDRPCAMAWLVMRPR